jgi:hypothetical protein
MAFPPPRGGLIGYAMMRRPGGLLGYAMARPPTSHLHSAASMQRTNGSQYQTWQTALRKDCMEYCTDKCIDRGLNSDAPFCLSKCLAECNKW